MKLLRHGPVGAERPGLLDAAGRIRDLSAHLPHDLAGEVLSDPGLARLRALDVDTLPVLPEDTRLGCPVARVGKFVAIGLNYRDHAEEAGMAIPAEPIVFMKATSCIAGPDDDLPRPPDAHKMDWEAELGIVIGTRASRVAEAQALDHVAGYVLVNDVSERAWQLERGGTWDKGKGADGFGPIGPWLVTRDEIPDPQALPVRLWLNGEAMQDGSTATMIFSCAHIVAYVSRFMTLHPGDVITTGTPPGVGMAMKPPRFLRAGDVMELEIAGLGRQRQRVVDAG